MAIVPKNTKLYGRFRSLAIRLNLIPIVPPFTPEYAKWIQEKEEKLYINQPKQHNKPPLISVVVPAYNTPDRYLLPMVYSVVNQSYENWELIVANASTDSERAARINKLSEIDNRIITFTIENIGIAENTNKAIERARGSYIAFMDHDDMLHSRALEEVEKALQNDQYDILYTDEDKISENGDVRHSPFIKPDWSPQLFTQLNYINHLTVVKASHISSVGGLRQECNGAQDYDLLLRIVKKVGNPKIKHINRILYHWRVAENSTAQDISNKSYVFEAGEKALTEFLNSPSSQSRLGSQIHVKAIEDKPGFYRTYVDKEDYQPVTVALWNVSSQQIIDDVSVSPYVTFVLSNKKSATRGFEYVPSSNVEGFIRSCMQRSKTGNRLLLVQGGVKPVTKKWIEVLLSYPDFNGLRSINVSAYDKNRRITRWPKAEIGKGKYVDLFEGVLFRTNTFFGDTDWVRNVRGNAPVSLIFTDKKEGSDIVIPYVEFETHTMANRRREKNYYDVDFYYGDKK